METEFKNYTKDGSGNTVESPGQTGFQSPCNDYLDDAISLDRLYIDDPACTFFARMVGDAMTGDRIFDGDLLVVDKSKTPNDGDIILCYYEGEFHVRRIKFGIAKVHLIASNPKFPMKIIEDGEELMLWGVIRSRHGKTR